MKKQTKTFAEVKWTAADIRQLKAGKKMTVAQADLVDIWGIFKPFVVKMSGEEKKPWEPE